VPCLCSPHPGSIERDSPAIYAVTVIDQNEKIYLLYRFTGGIFWPSLLGPAHYFSMVID